ncbi:MAG TPA: copper-binding protein [Blastocatellia bacterium]|nr:copper-binding protein [Blastocatellia bacterium]
MNHRTQTWNYDGFGRAKSILLARTGRLVISQRALILCCLVLLAGMGGCRKSAAVRPTHEGVEGVVVTVDKDQGTIQINHDEIKGYMPGMSMSFRVKKKFLLDDIRPGDRVTFTLRDTGNGYVISQLKKQ